MAIDSILRGLALQTNDAADPGVTPELAYGFTNTAGQTWMLGRITATEQGSFGGRLVIETNAGGGAPGNTTIARLTINQSGHVGIGTISPGQALDVAGQGLFRSAPGRERFQAWRGRSSGSIQAMQAEQASSGHTQQRGHRRDSGWMGTRSSWPPPGPSGCAWTAGGNVGIGTTNPATKLEVVGNWTGEEGALRLTGDKPTVRFSGGALAGNQVWILHLGSNGPGNLEFFRRTGPASWSNVMSLAPTGNVGIGTPAPATKLHVRGARIRLEKAGTNQVLDLRADGSALDIESAGADLHLNSNNLPVRIRNLIQGSSRAWKEDIADLPLESAMHILQHLNPISFAFKEDAVHQQHLGFVAEDVPAMVATPDQKGFSPMAIIAVLTKVVKQQQEQIAAFHKVVKQQQEQLSAFHEDMIWLKDRVI